MFRKSTPEDLAAASVSMAAMMLEAQSVIGMRVLGMMGLRHMEPGESMLMVHEKTNAMTDVHNAMAQAFLNGEGPGGIAVAGITPLRDRTRANAKRLSLQDDAAVA